MANEKKTSESVSVTDCQRRTAELTAKYLQDLTQQLAEIKSALEDENYTFIKTQAHNIKGASGTYQLNTIYEKALQLEQFTNNQSGEEILITITQIMNLVEEEIQQLNLETTSADSSSQRTQISDSGPLILTVDDDPNLLNIVEDRLREWGYTHRSVTNPAKMWEELEQVIPNAILLDIKLGDDDGIALVSQLKQRFPFVPIIMITAYGTIETAVKSIKNGAYNYVCKPLDFDRLYVELNRAIEYNCLSLQVKTLQNASNQERRETEQQLKASNQQLNVAIKQVVKANKAKSRFLANTSHEIRTPMNAIIGFGELLADEELTDRQKDYVNTICNSGKHLLQLINDILDFSKIEADKLEIELEECSLRNLLTNIESMIYPLTAGKDLKFEIRENSGLPANIYTDPARVQQCLINLVNNAVKFTKKGHVYVDVSLEDKDNQPYIRFDVEDTGIGIPPEKQEKVFESFTQADGSTSRIYGGTGLGLVITKQLVKLLGGELTLTSEEGKGSVFSLTIPAGLDVTKQPLLDIYNIASHTNIAREQTEQPEFSGHVLVAEDIKSNQKLIKSLLERFGFQVTIAEDGNQAIQKTLEQSFDLVFMDIQMPNMNGYEATRALRNNGVETPIIALTANAMKSDDKKCIEAGCNAYLSKPIGREKLLRMIRKYFSEKNETACEKIDTIKSQVDELSHTVVDTVFAKDKSEPQPAQNTSEEKIIDWADLLGRCSDAKLAKEVVELFLVDNPEIVQILRDSVRSFDAKTIKSQAHRLSGSAKAIGAAPLSQVALKLELAAEEQNFETIELLLAEIETEFEKITALLSQPDWNKVVEQQCNKQLKS